MEKITFGFCKKINDMQRHFAIFNSDQVSKDGTQFSIGALEDGIWQACHDQVCQAFELAR